MKTLYLNFARASFDGEKKFYEIDLRYNMKVTAHNNAGFSVAEYEFATLTVTGGKTGFSTLS